MPPIDVLVDASVVIKWFHAEGESGVEAARALLDRYRERQLGLYILDLTLYEVGNALLRGRGLAADRVSVVLSALGELVPRWVVRPVEWHLALSIAEANSLTLYDAAYAAVAQARGGLLATYDRALLAAGLGARPAAVLETVQT